jgi:hypothetical protein
MLTAVFTIASGLLYMRSWFDIVSHGVLGNGGEKEGGQGT